MRMPLSKAVARSLIRVAPDLARLQAEVREGA
jgi:hypothetical protein